MKNQVFNCPVEATLSLIGGKYKPLILWHLSKQPLHYMEIQRRIPRATPKMLSQQLHHLESCGMDKIGSHLAVMRQYKNKA